MSHIIKAAQFAAEAHRGQTRKYTRRPYIEHPARVAARVMMLPRVTEDTVCAAWMHDVLEDCPGVEIPAIFPPWCYNIIKELTNPSKEYPHLSRSERKAMDRNHLRNVSYWARVIKLVDRIDNVRDMRQAPSDFRQMYMHESELLREALVVPFDRLIEDLTDELQQAIDEAAWL